MNLVLPSNKLVNIVSIVFGIGGILTSIIIYNLSNKSRQPTVVFDPTIVEIINRDNVNTLPITISDENGNPITKNLFSRTFYFFNNGELPIKPEHVLKPISLSLSGEDS